MNLLPEHQLEYLTSLPYHDLIRYCQADQKALQLCYWEEFWNRKLSKTIYSPVPGRPIPPNLSLISGNSPATRFHILDTILGSAAPLEVAVDLGQYKLVKYWVEQYPVQSNEIEGEVLYNLARRENQMMLKLLWDNWYNLNDRESTFGSALTEAITENEIDVIALINSLMEIDPIQLAYLSSQRDDEDYALMDHLISEQLKLGREDFANELAFYLHTQEPFPQEALSHLIKNYEINVRGLLELALGECPKANLYYNFL